MRISRLSVIASEAKQSRQRYNDYCLPIGRDCFGRENAPSQ